MAEVQGFSINKATKESLKALAMGWEVEKKAAEPVVENLKGILGIYLSTEVTPKLARKIDCGINKTRFFIQRRKYVI